MQDSALARTALVMLAAVGVGAALSWAAGIVTPLVLALFLTVLIDSFARFLQRRAPLIPGWADLPVAILLSLIGFGLVVYVVVDNAASFSAQLLSEGPKLNATLNRLALLVGLKAPPTLEALVNQLNPTAYLGAVAKATQSVASGGAYVLIYSGFLIASRSGFMRKVQALWPDPAERDAAASVFNRIRDGVERYLWIQTVSGGLIAVASWGVMAIVGLENPAFWAFLIFVLVFIPVVGGLVAALLPPLFALVQFPTLWPAAEVFIGLQVVFFVVGSILLPRMQRDGLNIDPVVVLLSLAFWGAIWGVAGMFLSTPLTVTAIIIMAQFPQSRWLAILLSGDGAPETSSPPGAPVAKA